MCNLLKPNGNDLLYCIDFAVCIDATSGLRPVIHFLRDNATAFLCSYNEFMNEFGMCDISMLRLKVIAFRDDDGNNTSMMESEFFVLPDQHKELEQFLDGIALSDRVAGPKSAFDAVGLALQSSWTTLGLRRRHFIFLLTGPRSFMTEVPSDPSEERSNLMDSLQRLKSQWDATESTAERAFSLNCVRLIPVLPDTEPWLELLNWDRCCPVLFRPGENWLESVDGMDLLELAVSAM